MSGEDSAKMENEVRNMRKKVDELKSPMRTKAERIWMG